MARGVLSRAAVIDAAIAIADEEGLRALSMRRLGEALGVEAMSLYHHVANKDDIHHGLVDRVWEQVDLARDETDWRAALHRVCGSAHRAMLAHPWFFALPITYGGESRLHVIEAMLAHLDHGGVPPELAFHAQHVLDGHVFGYSWQAIGFADLEALRDQADDTLARISATAFPYVRAHARQHFDSPPPGDGFAVGLDLMLDGLVR
ncbi:TetR/AcrR family transcriptional regulator [Demequina sp. NBRC 110053]|uniref:TetR/AcrR family transcriptional regulator n=1 Tax=Demequina sp. NBRC 110053 TaxID=1570342 RepID=UPI000A00BFA2|nr:TetR/AcrR family transcriptional regulator C-terminal domain-containing protein [Demequina sp. NBRC 110053]